MDIIKVDCTEIQQAHLSVLEDMRRVEKSLIAARSNGWFRIHKDIPSSTNVVEAYTDICHLMENLESFKEKLLRTITVATTEIEAYNQAKGIKGEFGGDRIRTPPNRVNNLRVAASRIFSMIFNKKRKGG